MNLSRFRVERWTSPRTGSGWTGTATPSSSSCSFTSVRTCAVALLPTLSAGSQRGPRRPSNVILTEFHTLTLTYIHALTHMCILETLSPCHHKFLCSHREYKGLVGSNKRNAMVDLHGLRPFCNSRQSIYHTASRKLSQVKTSQISRCHHQ